MGEITQLAWKVSAARGVLGVIFGLVLVIWPTTALLLVLLWGIFVLVDGIGWLATGFGKEQSGATRAASIALGVAALVAAVFAIFRPGVTVAALFILLGIWLFVRGVASAALGLFAARGRTRVWVVLGGLLDVAIGVLFFLNPAGSASFIVVLIGIGVILWGVVFLLLAYFLRKFPEDVVAGEHIVIKSEVVDD